MSYNWNGWDGELKGTCVKTNALVVAAAAFNIVLDIWVISLPIPRVLTLQASLHTKLQVVFMFSVGFLWVSPPFSSPEIFEHPAMQGANIFILIRITGVGIYRAIILKLFATSTNPTCIAPYLPFPRPPKS